MSEDLLNITQLAHRLGVRERVAMALVNEGKIRAVRIGTFLRFRPKDIERFLESVAGIDPAKYLDTPSVTPGIPEGPEGTSEAVITLPRGPKGRNRERLAKGEGVR
jgi:excisionase family DNA binding protein